MSKNFLLITGSPRGKNSTSESVGLYFLDKIQQYGHNTDTYRIPKSVLLNYNPGNLIQKINQSNFIIIATPNYFFNLPAIVCFMLEYLEKHKEQINNRDKINLAAIINGHFSEAWRSELIISTFKSFAEKISFNWIGGLCFGNGNYIDGAPFNEKDKKLKNIGKALELAAKSLASNEPISAEAIKLMALPIMTTQEVQKYRETFLNEVAKENQIDLKDTSL